MNYEAINFGKKFKLFDEQWRPKVIAEMNDYQFKIVKLQGDFVWHGHKNTDEAFIVLEGTLRIDFGTAPSTCRLAKCSWFQRASTTSRMPSTRSNYCLSNREECSIRAIRAATAPPKTMFGFEQLPMSTSNVSGHSKTATEFPFSGVKRT